MRVQDETQTSAPSSESVRQIFSPGIIADVNLGGRVERVHSGFAVAAQHNGTDVAGPHAVVLDQVGHAGDQLFDGEVHVNAINLGRIQQPLHVFFGAKDGGAAGQGVATDALEHGRAVVNHVRHHVNLGAVPGNEFAVMPDFLGLLNRHEYSYATTKNYNRATAGRSPYGTAAIPRTIGP